MSQSYIKLSGAVSGQAETFSDFASFPASGTEGQLAIAKDTDVLYYWDSDDTSWVPLGGSGGSGTYNPELTITLSPADIASRYVVLALAPSDKAKTRVTVIGGPAQDYAVDYVITTDNSDRRLSWDGLGLQALLASGDKLLVTYN